MDIYKRALRTVLATVCTCSAVAGIGMVAAPGSALAAPCLTGSGSSLQSEQQQHWIGLKPLGCAEEVSYKSTSSGKGLTEFGLEGAFELTPVESGTGVLDGFIGTDDAPTTTVLAHTETGAKKADSKAETMPIVAAPIAVILDPPTACKVTTGFKIPNAVLNELWLGKYTEWGTFLTAAGAAHSGTCTAAVTRQVRSDSSGTSFAFKQYLCQINPSGWGKVTNASECESGKEFVVDAATWPGTVSKEHEEGSPLKKVPNEGSKGEANAVFLTPGSVGYVNLANAVSAGFKPYGTGTGQSVTKFWAQIENEAGPPVEDSEPISGTKGNCPTTFGGTIPAIGASWSTVHLAKLGQKGAYPICTFTYDIAWHAAKYLTAELEKEYGGKAAAEAIGAKAKAYFEYMAGGLTGDAAIAEYYSPLPKNVRERAEEIAPEVG
jgi:ABC-type phosphate transport system substrate-binding protein